MLRAIRAAFGDDLVAVYLFGSAAAGTMRPASDLDLMAVAKRRTDVPQKEALVAALLEVSSTPRPVEVTVVVRDEVVPWRYPPRMDFQFGEWWRSRYEAGELEPWDSETNPDLAVLLTMVLSNGRALSGPPPGDVFMPPPWADVVAASIESLDALVDDIGWDTRNVVLTLARIWSSLVTGEILGKEEAAQWALSRVSPQHRGVLDDARTACVSGSEMSPGKSPARARDFATFVTDRIREQDRRNRRRLPT